MSDDHSNTAAGGGQINLAPFTWDYGQVLGTDGSPFVWTDGTEPAAWFTDGTNLALTVNNVFSIWVDFSPGPPQQWMFNNVGFWGPGGFNVDNAGDVTCQNLTVNGGFAPASLNSDGGAFTSDGLGNVTLNTLIIGGNVVLNGQMANIAPLAPGATLAQVITAFNTLLSELQTAGLMA
jgi:hypothetical protein